MHDNRIAVIGLGYVGLPLAHAFAEKPNYLPKIGTLEAIKGYNINQ
jgi:UDP-N-acetyl-D-mannosaminuronate dehydrogenase